MNFENIIVSFPDNKISNLDIQGINSGLDLDKVKDSVGVESRYWTTSSDMSDLFSKNITKANYLKNILNGEKILVISSTQTGARRFPGYSNQIQYELGASGRSVCFDLNMGCSSYIYACYLADLILSRDNEIKNVIIHTMDSYSPYIDKTDLSILPVFGACSAITHITRSERAVSFDFVSDGGNWHKLTLIDQNIKMDGPAVFQFVVANCKNLIESYLDEEVENLYLHQATKITIDALKSRIKHCTRIPMNISNFGNCTSSSIPLLIEDDMRNNQFSNNFVAVGYGVGLSAGLMKIR